MATLCRLYRRACPNPTSIELDTDVPDYSVLMAEADKASAILTEASQVFA